jgi:hypothetical protein
MDEGGEPEHIQVHAPEVDALAARAELLHLPQDEPMATQTQTQVQVVLRQLQAGVFCLFK